MFPYLNHDVGDVDLAKTADRLRLDGAEWKGEEDPATKGGEKDSFEPVVPFCPGDPKRGGEVLGKHYCNGLLNIIVL